VAIIQDYRWWHTHTADAKVCLLFGKDILRKNALDIVIPPPCSDEALEAVANAFAPDRTALPHVLPVPATGRQEPSFKDRFLIALLITAGLLFAVVLLMLLRRLSSERAKPAQ
jgi:hypothetical protein